MHEIRDDIKSKIANWKEAHAGENIVDLSKNYAGKNETRSDDYSHIYRLVQ